jgi:hypothetical protein
VAYSPANPDRPADERSASGEENSSAREFEAIKLLENLKYEFFLLFGETDEEARLPL